MVRQKSKGGGNTQSAHDYNAVPPISDKEKRSAMIVLAGVSITVKATPVDLLTVFAALDLYHENTQEEIL